MQPMFAEFERSWDLSPGTAAIRAAASAGTLRARSPDYHRAR